MHTHTLLLLLLLLKPGVCESCSLVVSPAELVVKYGAPASANCTSDTVTFMGWEPSQGESQVFSTRVKELTWRVDSLTDWNIKPQCFEMSEEGGQCARVLNVTVYKLPDRVSIRYLSHSGPVVEGHQYSLHCVVQNIAPIEHLRVTFFKVSTNGEQAVLYTQLLNNDIQQRNNDIREPVNESFSLQFSPTSVDNIKTPENGTYTLDFTPSRDDDIKTPGNGTYTLDFTPSRDDDGAQLCCSAMLDLGPEGPQPPPVMESDRLNINVHYKPLITMSPGHFSMNITEGDTLSLACSAKGNPAPSYDWLLPQSDPAPNTTESRSVVTITNMAYSHSGEYTCNASNPLGHSTWTVNVEVTGASCQAAGSAMVAVLLLQLIHWL